MNELRFSYVQRTSTDEWTMSYFVAKSFIINLDAEAAAADVPEWARDQFGPPCDSYGALDELTQARVAGWHQSSRWGFLINNEVWAAAFRVRWC